MPRAAVATAVQDHLAANWTTTPIAPLNAYGSPPDDASAFIMVDYPVANEEQMSIGAPGNNVWREEGVVQIIICVPRGGGTGLLFSYGDTIASLFRGQRIGEVQCEGTSSPRADITSEDGNYFVGNVSVVYHHDLFG